MAGCIVAERDAVVVGVDTHADIHVAVALSSLGARLGSRIVATTPAGFGELVDWVGGFGPVRCFGVEGTGSYGAALARHLGAAGHAVVEVDRPDRRTRRLKGKSDPVDAEAAARAVLAGTASGCPNAGDGHVEMIRSLRVARRSALKARTQATNQLLALVLTSPDELRASLRSMSLPRLVKVAAVPARAAPRSSGCDEARPSASRSSARLPQRGDRRARPGPGAGGVGGRPGVAGASRSGDRCRRSATGRGRGQPRAPVERGCLRQAVRGGAASGLLGQDQPASVEPRWGPDRQQRAVADRPGQDEFRSQDEDLCGAADQGGAVQEGDHPVSQTIRGAGGLSPSRGG